MMRRLLAATALLGAAGCLQAGTPADYARVLPIATPAGRSESAWRLELTADAYAVLQDPGLGDLEVFNADGNPVPLARYDAGPAAPRIEDRALPLLALPATLGARAEADLRLVIERDAGGRLQRIDAGEHAAAVPAMQPRDWLLDAGAGRKAIDRIVLHWSAPAAGVVARFDVDAGDDLEHWHRVGSGTVLVLEQDGARLERHAIELHGVRANYLRLHRVDDGAALEGLAAHALASATDAAPARTWTEAIGIASPAGTRKASIAAARFDYRLAAALPVEAARIELAGDNALAPIDIEARAADGAPWRVLAQATAFRLRSGDDVLHNEDIALAQPMPLREWRLESRVPVATAPHLWLAWRPATFVFLAEGPGPYTLAAGSARARHAGYPVDAALASLRAKLGRDWQPPLATLGTPRESGGAAALQPQPLPTPWRRWLLWGVLVAGAALVGGFALSLLRAPRH